MWLKNDEGLDFQNWIFNNSFNQITLIMIELEARTYYPLTMTTLNH